MPRLRTNAEKAAYARDYYARPENAIKNKARGASKQAIRMGQLVRGPCEKCGEPKTEGHHDDYSKPLDIRWLCKTHHAAVHWGERKEKKPVSAARPRQPGCCARGHALSGYNLVFAGKSKKRRCRQCHAMSNLKSMRRSREARRSVGAQA